MISSLLAKYRYGAPTDTPASTATSGIDVWWKPSRAKQRPAADTINARFSARWASVMRGTNHTPLP